MSLKKVFMTPEVYCACTMQAFSTEKEEIMGLLYGKFEDNQAHVLTMKVLPRSDKRKDRVEIEPGKLIEAASAAPVLSADVGEEVNIIGWYHSHPHITVEPSHMDLKTQLTQQQMDDRFFGIIVSVFNADRNSGQEIQITCFQTDAVQRTRRHIPLLISPIRRVTQHGLKLLPQIPAIFTEEETIMHCEMMKKTEHLSRICNDAAYVMNLSNILKMSVSPLMVHLEQRIEAAKKKNKSLKATRDELLRKISESCSIKD